MDNIARMRQQLRSMGAMWDWEREVVTCQPEYYRWNQWFFLKMYERGLAYRALAPVDWCPQDNTTLAREQVVGEERVCERCGTPVVKKNLEQWFLKITAYAEELLDFSKIQWPERVVTLQRNWIGRSEGVEFAVEVRDHPGVTFRVFTTRPDTVFGMTFCVLAPEHPLVDRLVTPDRRAEVEAYKFKAARASDIERLSTEKERDGVFIGAHAINPMNGVAVPIFIADYVLLTYGTGAIMGVPAHDDRDFDFARKYGLPIPVVVAPPGWDGQPLAAAYLGEGTMVHSGEFDGLPSAVAWQRIADAMVARGIGERKVHYRLHDWLISRQRYFGTPIPIIYCGRCGIVPVPYEDLPVVLPEDAEFRPTGESPLKYHEGFRRTTCPRCRGEAERETDTMDTFVDSSWYQYRYLSPHYDQGPFDPAVGRYWLPVDQYTGGVEHAVMHLLYTRFWTKVMRDLGLVTFDEPMLRLFNQGMILGEPRDGDMIIAAGAFETDKLFKAKSIRVVESVTDVPITETQVAGEVMNRVETTLHVRTPDGREIVVDTDKDTTFDIPGFGPDATINQIKHHLDVEKMSKTQGNVVAPDELVEQFGADTVRAYLMFAFRWEQGGPWDSKGIYGVVRWLNDVWTLVNDGAPEGTPNPAAERDLRRKVHQTIKKVSDGLETFGFNTAMAGLMELKNTLQKVARERNVSREVWDEAVRTMLLLMAPFTPFVAEELWERIGQPYSIHQQSWPVFDPEIAAEEQITLVVQVNGKVRDRLQVPANITEEEAKRLALESEGAKRHMDGKQPRKVIFVADRGMVNIVV
jgi:leucyl-tRNA synthetase